MKLISSTTAGIVAAYGIILGAAAHASDSALPDPRIGNAAISIQQTDELRKTGLTIATANRNVVSELKIRGRIQGQFAYAEGNDGNDYSTFELRRARLGVQGRILDEWSFIIEANILSEADLDSAMITYDRFPQAHISFGKGKPRFGHEENTSSASILTIERSRLTGLFNGGKPLGLRVHGEIGKFAYSTGIFNGTNDSTSRMATRIDSYLFNASAGIDLEDWIDTEIDLRFRIDYLNNNEAMGYYRFENAVAVSAHFSASRFDVRSEYMWGSDHTGRNARGWYVMPSYYIISKRLQGVLRYESVQADVGSSVGVNRYADRIPDLYASGNRYRAFYVGLNYFIRGDNLKVMAGVERATNEDSSLASNSRGRATTFMGGIRMQF